MSDQDLKALVLLESLKYIKKFHGQTIVIKYGGHAMTDPQMKASVVKDIVLLKYIGLKPVVVHGGGPEINATMAVYGKEPEFKEGLRVTDEETMEITQMVLAGKLGPSIVSIFNANGVPAVALNGKDGNMIQAKQLDPGLGQVGEITGVDASLIKTLVDNGYIPVISTVGVGEDGESYNINGDTAAGHIAAAVGAYKLLLLTDVDGVFKDLNDPSTFIQRFNSEEARLMIQDGTFTEGMIPKIESALIALEGGVDRCHIINGKKPHAILLELLTDSGIGSMISL